MFSLKRLLNEDGNGDPEQMADGERAKQVRQNDTLDSIPALANRSWSDLWGGLLSADFTDSGNFLDTSGDEAGITPFYSVEEGIESWAAQSLLTPLDDLPLESQPPSSELPLADTGELICYGMIYRAAVKVMGNMLELDSKLSTGGGSLAKDCYSLGIVNSPADLNLKFADGMEFGILNAHTSTALRGILDKLPVEFETFGSTLKLRETIGRATRASDAIVYVNINVYGGAEAAKEVGRHLSVHKVYLQRPIKQRPETIYDNPHILKFSDMHMQDIEYQLELAPPRPSSTNDAEHFQQTISNVYGTLTRGKKLNRVEGDHRLTAKLYPHQQEALDFMIQRETGPIPAEFCLWKPMSGNEEGWYCHAVTNARTRTQSSETGGGILADEPGMGKTLSILSLVTKTLKVANYWVATQNENTADASHLKKTPSRATLVIVPSAVLISQWLDEIDIHLDGTLKTVKYHGQRRKALTSLIEDADIVLTTYHTLVSDFREKLSLLHEIDWFRVVLDEAHTIRRQKTSFYRAVSDLKASSRWCLTGTPIQNRLEDIGALFAFIGVRPFHSIAMFRRFVIIPYNESDERRLVATRNLTLLLDSLCLRRSTDLLHLPERQDQVRMIEFSEEERNQYDQTMKIMNRALRQRAGESYSKSIFGMFQIQLQLRILCNHGTYQHSFSWNKRSLLDEKEAALCSVGGSSEVNCSACRQSMPILGSNNVYRTYPGNCAHVLCSECLDEDEQIYGDVVDQIRKCPLCAISGVPVTATGVAQSESATKDQRDSYLRINGHSSKMDALMSDIRKDLWKTKSIIFSCWTNTLNLVERYLHKDSIPFRRIDGECPSGRRNTILDEFSQTPSIPVLIMTTGTGAVGLNITSANRVFIIEPQWNPSVENQAISRAIRMRQTNSVLVTRYIVKGTVEQEMRSQQEKKMQIAEIGNNTTN